MEQMIRIRRGKVSRILGSHEGLTEIEVEVDGAKHKAVNLDALTGPVTEGSEVVLNTTATALGLGSGGYDFVIFVVGNDHLNAVAPGHIIKLRYTPLQVKCLSVEEQDSPYHQAVKNFKSLAGMPVIVGSLHSMLAPAVVALKAAGRKPLKVAYVMTDGAALPIAFSRTVRELKAGGFLAGAVTVGHAFGGDLEAVNKHSGLIAAREALEADVAVVTMGPGIVGTGTKYGNTALEQGEIVDAVDLLGGRAIAIPRLSFADPRPRHKGVSHHFLTALGEVARSRAVIAMPKLDPDLYKLITEQLTQFGVMARHQVETVDVDFLPGALQKAGITVSSMGRGYEEDPAFFKAAAAAGVIAAQMVNLS
ncbi:MAG: DUF3866 family protein [Syntrophothermus sp.]